MSQTTRDNASANSQTLYMAMELSKRTWKLGFSTGNRRCRKVNVQAGNLVQLDDAVRIAKDKLGLGDGARVLSCYEAGRDGFWPHRLLEKMGVDNVVIDPASVEVNRRKRRAKNDRLDVEMLLRKLIAYHEHDREIWSVVRVPSTEDEDQRRIHRELDRLTSERTGHCARIQSLLATVGVERKVTKKFAAWLATAQQWDGSPLPAALKAEVSRELVRLELVEAQMAELKRAMNERIQQPKSRSDQMAARLMELKAIGLYGGWILAKELFGWREFQNRREVGAIAGLTPTPFDSGGSEHEQGISKAGNRRVRKLMTQLAWGWVRYQPDSKLSQWFEERFGRGSKRSRRVGIIALSRKLLIVLWRWADQGVVPDGSQLRALPKAA